LNGALEGAVIGEQFARIETNPLKEEPRNAVRMLIGVQNIGSVTKQDLGQSCDDAPTVFARHEQRGDRS
jgi:hypothetical protein